VELIFLKDLQWHCLVVPAGNKREIAKTETTESS